MTGFGAFAKFARRYHLGYHSRSSSGVSPKTVEYSAIDGPIVNRSRPVLQDPTGLFADVEWVRLNVRHHETFNNLLHKTL